MPVDIADRTDAEMFRWFEPSTTMVGDDAMHHRIWCNPMGSYWVVKKGLRKLGLNSYELAKHLGPFEQRYISYLIGGTAPSVLRWGGADKREVISQPRSAAAPQEHDS